MSSSPSLFRLFCGFAMHRVKPAPPTLAHEGPGAWLLPLSRLFPAPAQHIPTLGPWLLPSPHQEPRSRCPSLTPVLPFAWPAPSDPLGLGWNLTFSESLSPTSWLQFSFSPPAHFLHRSCHSLRSSPVYLSSGFSTNMYTP